VGFAACVLGGDRFCRGRRVKWHETVLPLSRTKGLKGLVATFSTDAVDRNLISHTVTLRVGCLIVLLKDLIGLADELHYKFNLGDFKKRSGTNSGSHSSLRGSTRCQGILINEY